MGTHARISLFFSLALAAALLIGGPSLAFAGATTPHSVNATITPVEVDSWAATQTVTTTGTVTLSSASVAALAAAIASAMPTGSASTVTVGAIGSWGAGSLSVLLAVAAILAGGFMLWIVVDLRRR